MDAQVNTHALLKDENVKEEIAETNTEAIERVKIGSNKICIRQDLAKGKMVFGLESSQAIIDMCNVELIESKKSRNQCPSCLHDVFKGTILCSCGKHIRGDDTTYQSSFFEKFQTRPELVARTPPQSQKTLCMVVRKRKEVRRRSRIDGRTTKPTGSRKLPLIGRMLG